MKYQVVVMEVTFISLKVYAVWYGMELDEYCFPVFFLRLVSATF
jgi:hypothetical protein